MTETCLPQSAEDRPINEILDQVEDAAQGKQTSVADLMDALGPISQSGLLLVPALIVVTPLSGIPGLSSVLGLTIALLAGQMVFGRRQLWLPDWLLKRSISSKDLTGTLDKIRGLADAVDQHTQPRLKFLVKPPFRLLLQLICMLSGLAMPFLEFVPFSSSLLGCGVTFFATALLARDGLLAAAGIAIFGFALSVIASFLF